MCYYTQYMDFLMYDWHPSYRKKKIFLFFSSNLSMWGGKSRSAPGNGNSRRWMSGPLTAAHNVSYYNVIQPSVAKALHWPRSELFMGSPPGKLTWEETQLKESRLARDQPNPGQYVLLLASEKVHQLEIMSPRDTVLPQYCLGLKKKQPFSDYYAGVWWLMSSD